MPAAPVAARAALHLWEEPPISGKTGTGAIFFSGCSLDCVFCQNEEISHGNVGKQLTVARLRDICYELAEQGATSISLINPTHYAHTVRELLAQPLPLPVVWNSGGYDRVETLRGLAGKLDVYLPDLKYLDSETAARYSAAPDYPEIATAAIREMVDQTGPVVLEDGLLRRGVLIRHLILPGQVNAAKQVMDWVAENFPPGTVLFSLMSQYTPWGRARELSPLNRSLRRGEIRAAVEYMKNLGLQGYVQESSAATGEFIPAFDFTGL